MILKKYWHTLRLASWVICSWLGSGAYTGAVFHVMTHAFFKALLFLGAGSVIHAMGGEQDMRNMGGLKKYMSITHLTFLLGCLAIAGMPPFSGFFSKDEILAAAYAKNPVLWSIGVLRRDDDRFLYVPFICDDISGKIPWHT